MRACSVRVLQRLCCFSSLLHGGTRWEQSLRLLQCPPPLHPGNRAQPAKGGLRAPPNIAVAQLVMSPVCFLLAAPVSNEHAGHPSDFPAFQPLPA